jgi:predicted ester cyclase
VDRIELVKSAYDLDDPEQYSHYSDDFQYSDALGGPPQDRDTWISMGQLMRSAFPDLSLVIEDTREEGDDVVVTSHFSGTFSNDMDLSPLGLGVIPSTGKTADFPSATNQVSFENGKISKMYGPDTGQEAGMAGILKAFGVDIG